ncbi:uncharacterized protein LOC112085234 isoform X2 [Eutrema salsugineum]|uniref:uncharacterized protein LOC112085234 isoform X2 n=1 Tax=Eutrema salsugineum TaxID=72664 RepID=UPI000CED3925|nr:uncharacterized protein LOC112085234 isoform X2 [Eutrema salsugineum]
MEKREPSLVPEWLRSTGHGSGVGSKNHILSSSSRSDSSLSHNSKSRNSRSKCDVDSARSPFLDRSSSTNARRGFSNGSTKNAYSSFNVNRSHRDKDRSREKDTWSYMDPWDNDNPQDAFLIGRDQEKLRRSQSMTTSNVEVFIIIYIYSLLMIVYLDHTFFFCSCVSPEKMKRKLGRPQKKGGNAKNARYAPTSVTDIDQLGGLFRYNINEVPDLTPREFVMHNRDECISCVRGEKKEAIGLIFFFIITMFINNYTSDLHLLFFPLKKQTDLLATSINTEEFACFIATDSESNIDNDEDSMSESEDVEKSRSGNKKKGRPKTRAKISDFCDEDATETVVTRTDLLESVSHVLKDGGYGFHCTNIFHSTHNI